MKLKFLVIITDSSLACYPANDTCNSLCIRHFWKAVSKEANIMLSVVYRANFSRSALLKADSAPILTSTFGRSCRRITYEHGQGE